MLKHRAGGGWLAVHWTWVLKIWNGGNQKKNANTITRDDVWDSLILSADSTVRPRAGSTSLYWTLLPREEQTSIVRPPAVTREVEWQVGTNDIPRKVRTGAKYCRPPLPYPYHDSSRNLMYLASVRGKLNVCRGRGAACDLGSSSSSSKTSVQGPASDRAS